MRVKSHEFRHTLHTWGKFALLASSQALSSWVSDVLFMMLMEEIRESLLFADNVDLWVSPHAPLGHFTVSKCETVK